MYLLMAILGTTKRQDQETMGWLLLCSIIVTMIINLGKAFQNFYYSCTSIVKAHDKKAVEAEFNIWEDDTEGNLKR